MMTEPTLPFTRPAHVMTQTALTGDDWTSDRDRKAQARAEAARRKAALACAAKLEAAADALAAFSMACVACEDGSAPRGADDSRTLLAASMREYSAWLSIAFRSGR